MHLYAKLKVSSKMKTTSAVSYFLLLAFCGAAWVPLAAGIELSNVMAVVIFFVGLACVRQGFVLPPIYFLLLSALTWLYFMLALHNFGGEGQAIRSAAYVLMALALAQLPQPDMRRIITLSTAAFFGLIFVSSLLAGVGLISAIIDYLLTFNRASFIYQNIRPMLNGFSAADADYLASVMNTMASALAVLFIIAITHRAYVSAAATGIFVLILFSTSSLIPVILTLLLLGFRWIRASDFKIGPIIVVVAAIALIPLIIDQASAYLALNISEDGASRSARLNQYSAALEFINTSPMWGVGYVEINGQPIHNSTLFLWVSGGVVPAILMACVYGIVIWKLISSAILAMNGDIRWVCVSGLLSLFLIRVSFGGGGGLPEATAMAAVAVALGLEKRLQETGLVTV
jgi:hypothetical protein